MAIDVDRKQVLKMLRDGHSVNKVAATLNVNRYRIAKLAREICSGCLIEFRLSVVANKAKTLRALGIHWKKAAAYMGVGVTTYFRLLRKKRVKYAEGSIPVKYDSKTYRVQTLDGSRLIMTDEHGMSEIMPIGLVKGRCEVLEQNGATRE